MKRILETLSGLRNFDWSVSVVKISHNFKGMSLVLLCSWLPISYDLLIKKISIFR